MRAYYQPYTLLFKRPSGTSRGILYTKKTYFLYIEKEGKTAIGECNLFKGLSAEDTPFYEEKLQQICQKITQEKEIPWSEVTEYPSIQFGLEQAIQSLQNKDPHILFPSAFTASQKGIKINGLIWMGDIEFTKAQIREKLKNKFQCIKIKIGTHWEEEKKILTKLRNEFSPGELEIRVDANGAFSSEEAFTVLETLNHLKIHSIEQPIQQGQWEEMAMLCQNSPTPIALDEELIGIFDTTEKEALLKEIRPNYIILKPALIGGFKGSQEWINLAEKLSVNWWITSALESNVGLNAIAQWTATLNNPMPQGLGTGALYTNNIERPLVLKDDELWFTPHKK